MFVNSLFGQVQRVRVHVNTGWQNLQRFLIMGFSGFSNLFSLMVDKNGMNVSTDKKLTKLIAAGILIFATEKTLFMFFYIL